MNFAMATLDLKEMGKTLSSWLSQFSFAKPGIMKSGLDAMPLFLLDDLLRSYCPIIYTVQKCKHASNDCFSRLPATL